MICGKCQDELIKDDEIFCTECKTGYHCYCQGINENGFYKITKGQGNQNNNDKNYDIKQLTDSVKYMSNKFDQFNITVWENT